MCSLANYSKCLLCLLFALFAEVTLAALPSVKVASVQKMKTPPRLTLTGIITNKSEFDIISAVDGYLTFIKQPGELLTQGEVIAKIDDSLLALDVQELSTRIQRQKIHIEFYTKELKRLNKLKETQSVSQSSRDEVRYQQDLARNQLHILKSQLQRAKIEQQRTTIIAPANGVLSQRNKRQGEYIESGVLLGHFLASHDVEGEVSVPVRYANLLEPGQSIQLSSEHETSDATIQAVIPKVDERSQTVTVRFALPKTQQAVWYTGKQLTVHIPSMQQEALLIPRDALLVASHQSFVMRVSKETQQLEKVEVKVGYGEGEFIAITSMESHSLKAGDKIVVRGERLLAEGTKVSIEEL